MSERYSDAQFAAARVFVQEFAEISAYGGGIQARLRLGPDDVIRAIDGWKGRDAALDDVAHDLAKRVVILTHGLGGSDA